MLVDINCHESLSPFQIVLAGTGTRVSGLRKVLHTIPLLVDGIEMVISSGNAYSDFDKNIIPDTMLYPHT